MAVAVARGDRWAGPLLMVCGLFAAYVSLVAGVWPAVPMCVGVALAGFALLGPGSVPKLVLVAWFLVGLLSTGAGALLAWSMVDRHAGRRPSNDVPTCVQLASRPMGDRAAFDAYLANNCWNGGLGG